MLGLGLPKWPAMVVKGDPVTKEQAMEIIIRTSSFRYMFSNDKLFLQGLHYLIFGHQVIDKEDIAKNLGLDYNQFEGWVDSKLAPFKQIEGLDYLESTSRIVSCWIGGPKGWIDWDGNIFTNNYNIGKYPTVEEVLIEWDKIAKVFPFLNLRCQLFDGESGQEGIKPLVEYVVSGGKVDLIKPVDFICGADGEIKFDLNSPGRERGVSLSKFKEALNYVKDKYQTV